MVTTARRLGETPTLVERVLMLERIVAEQAEVIAAQGTRISAIESARDVDDQVDGPAPAALPPNWRPIKVAAPLVGYSESGLRAAMKRHTGGRRWWQYRDGRVLVDVDTCPRKQKRT
jgi:hypothetical protein